MKTLFTLLFLLPTFLFAQLPGDSTALYGRVQYPTPLKVEPNYKSQTVYLVPDGAIIKIRNHDETYWKAEANGNTGYIAKLFVVATGKSADEVEGPSKPAVISVRQVEEPAKPVTVPITEESYKPAYLPKRKVIRPVRVAATQHYTRGPRGGCYYITSSGRKEYVDRSLCN